MANSQQFSLRWNNYVQHVTEVFDSLRNAENLVDVTLCCEGRKLKAHKILLSASSGYFYEIFKENPCHHPVIIFQNVKFEDLEALVSFMYKGEVNVAQEGLSSFLSTAELLEVKGLMGSASSEPETLVDESELDDNEVKNPKNIISQKCDMRPGFSLANKRKTNDIKRCVFGDKEAINDYEEDCSQCVDSERTKLEDTFNNHETSEKKVEKPAVQSGASNECAVQEPLQVFAHGLWRRLHPSLKRFGCDECGKIFKHPRSLDHHKKMHEGRTTCPLCRRVFGRMYALRLHISSSHPGQLHVLHSAKSH